MPCASTLLDVRVRLSGLSAFGSIRNLTLDGFAANSQCSWHLQIVLADDEIVPAYGLAGPPTVAH